MADEFQTQQQPPVEQQQQQQPPAAAQPQSTLEALAREAGLVPSNQQQQQQQVPVTPEVEAVNGYLQQAFGVDLNGFAQTVAQMQEWQQQQQVLNNQNRLRQEWGTDYENRLSLVQKKLETLDPGTAQALDTIEGAKLLYQLAYYEQMAQQQQQRPQQAPVFPQGQNVQRSATGQSGQYTVKQSDLANPVMYRQLAEKFGANNPNWEADLWNQGQVFMDLRR